LLRGVCTLELAEQKLTQSFLEIDMEILPKQIYNYERLIKNDSVEALELKNKILEIIIENSMTPLLIELTAKFNWEVDEALIASMK
jgi:hypothetical protein